MRATIKAMDQSTQEDWALIANEQQSFVSRLPERILDHMRLLSGDFGGFPVDRLQHCLQTAIFQGYNFFHHVGLDRNMREQYRGSEHFDRTEAFIALYDNPAFEAEKPALSLDLFADSVRAVFKESKHSLYGDLLG